MTNEGQKETIPFPFTEFALRLEQANLKFTDIVKHRGRNAFQHLRFAWNIRKIDPAMAAFRAITAEEEASTGLILALQHSGYEGAEKLDRNNHSHKAAIHVLLRSVGKLFARLKLAPTLTLSNENAPPTIRIHFDVKALTGISEGEPPFGESVLPLDFNIGAGLKNYNFSAELLEFAGKRGHEKIRSFIKAEANMRNRILYASDKGVPKIEIKDEFIFERKDRVLTIVSLIVMILQTDQHQRFVAQCLTALLQALEKIEASEVPFDALTPSDQPTLLIENSPNTKIVSLLEGGERRIVLYKFQDKIQFSIAFLPVWRAAISTIRVRFSNW